MPFAQPFAHKVTAPSRGIPDKNKQMLLIERDTQSALPSANDNAPSFTHPLL